MHRGGITFHCNTAEAQFRARPRGPGVSTFLRGVGRFFGTKSWTNEYKKTTNQKPTAPEKSDALCAEFVLKSHTSLVATQYSARNVDAPQSERRVL